MDFEKEKQGKSFIVLFFRDTGVLHAVKVCSLLFGNCWRPQPLTVEYGGGGVDWLQEKCRTSELRGSSATPSCWLHFLGETALLHIQFHVLRGDE